MRNVYINIKVQQQERDGEIGGGGEGTTAEALLIN